MQGWENHNGLSSSQSGLIGENANLMRFLQNMMENQQK